MESAFLHDGTRITPLGCVAQVVHSLSQLVSYLVFWAESTTKDYIMAKNNIQSVSYLLCMQVIKPQIIPKPQNQSWHKFTENLHNHQTQIFWRISPFCIAPV